MNSEDLLSFFEKRISDDSILNLDKWQKDVLEHKGNITIRSGRQVGKSTVVGLKVTKLALEHPGSKMLVVAASQRQASLLFEKILSEFNRIQDFVLESKGLEAQKFDNTRTGRENKSRWEKENGIFEDTPTKTRIILKDGSDISSVPVGKTGIYIKGHSVDFLIADEAAFIPEMVWLAIKPMIAVSKQLRGLGWEILLSTPFGKGGYYYNSHNDSDYRRFHVSSEDCPRIPKNFLLKEKRRLSKWEYAQEYLGEFVDEFSQFFATDLIKSRTNLMAWERSTDYCVKYRYYLGVDIARYGADENAFVILEWRSDNNLRIVKVETTERRSITETAGRILKYDEWFKFSKVFIDDAGVGGGAYDILKKSLRNRLVGLNNASKSIENKRNRILKEDLYSNALVLLENERLNLLNSTKLQRSLKCMTFEYTADKNIKIYGNYSHISEALVRACWCTKAKGLKLFIA